MIKIAISAILTITIFAGPMAKPSEANMISDAAAAAWNTATDGIIWTTDRINDATDWTFRMLWDACNKLNKACDGLKKLTEAQLTKIYDLCNRMNSCEAIMDWTKQRLLDFGLWAETHPETMAWIEAGLIILPIGWEIRAGRLAGARMIACPLPEEEVLILRGLSTSSTKGLVGRLAPEAIRPETRIILEEAAETAARRGETTFSLCSGSSCTLPQTMRPKWPEGTRETLLERQGYKSTTGADLDLTDPAKHPIDHILPRACGGTDDISNLQILTQEENTLKGSFDRCTAIPTSLIRG